MTAMMMMMIVMVMVIVHWRNTGQDSNVLCVNDALGNSIKKPAFTVSVVVYRACGIWE